MQFQRYTLIYKSQEQIEKIHSADFSVFENEQLKIEFLLEDAEAMVIERNFILFRTLRVILDDVALSCALKEKKRVTLSSRVSLIE